jgi:hypothetical protein
VRHDGDGTQVRGRAGSQNIGNLAQTIAISAKDMHVVAARDALDQRIQVRDTGVKKDDLVRKSGTRVAVLRTELWRQLIKMRFQNHAIALS